MTDYDYFKQYVSEMERIKAKTAHDEHILEFQAMCAKMINDAIPDIKKQCLEEFKQTYHESGTNNKMKAEEVEVRINTESIRSQIIQALKKAFK